MEDKSTTTIPATAGNGKKPALDGDKKQKKRGSFTFIKAAMTMVRRRSNVKPKPVQVEVASKGMLEKLVGSMRPMHLQDNDSPPPSVQLTAEQSDEAISLSMVPSPQWSSSSSSVDSMSQYGSATNLQELGKGAESPSSSSTNLKEIDKGSESLSSRYASSTNLKALHRSESRYASAMDLQELYLKGESDEDVDESDDGLDNNGGDEMIDSKADEFIAQFYKQMKRQHLQSIEKFNMTKASRMNGG